jgi:hypothetical protein
MLGVDGATSPTLEEAGTVGEAYNGVTSYSTFWMMPPSETIHLVGNTVAPGDHISASVTRKGTSYTLQVTDSTHPANSFTTTQTCTTCKNSSAEWLSAVGNGPQGMMLPDFRAVTVSGAAVTAGSTTGTISTFGDGKLTMTDSSGHVMAQPGPLTGKGTSFIVTWKANS